MPDIGNLKVQVYRGNTLVPINNARVTITPTEETRQQVMLQTNAVGQTEVIPLQTPPLELSLDPNNRIKPYSICDVTVDAEGYENLIVKGCQILPETTALQICNLTPLTRETIEPITQVIVVPPNRQFGDFPPKIPEDPDKPLPPPPSGFVVLPAPVIPEFIVVHAGAPSNTAAPNYTVRFPDYVKNVASSEIYATWDEKAVRANIHCIISFALNRVFTEWYRSKGYNFQITNSTAFDQAFTFGRNIFDNISRIVDEIFTTYVRRIGAKQPLLTQYCDGNRVQCPGWLTQWGSQSLATQGYTPFQILTNFYGTNIELVQAEKVSGIPTSYPGYTLRIGSSGAPVRTVQTFLNRIAQNYPLIPKVAVDGAYGPATANAVKVFQGIFNLPQTGEVDLATWFKISALYVGVTKIAELRTTIPPKHRERTFVPPVAFRNSTNIPTVTYME